MLKKRIIPCLDIKNNRVVKGVNFEGLKDAGDPVELASRYAAEGADELVFLDISATIDRRKNIPELVRSVASAINIPFTVGGGIHSLHDATSLVKAGADKVSLNSAAVLNPYLIRDIAACYGVQCVVVAIDAKWVNDDWMVTTHGGNMLTRRSVVDWAMEAEHYGAGEILLTSMNNDGVKKGYDIALVNEVCRSVNIPVIASGGAGTCEHFLEVFNQSEASGALAASIFHYGEVNIRELKKYLNQEQIPVRCN